MCWCRDDICEALYEYCLLIVVSCIPERQSVSTLSLRTLPPPPTPADSPEVWAWRETCEEEWGQLFTLLGRGERRVVVRSLMANTSLSWGLGSAGQWRLERGGRPPVWNILSPVSSLQPSHTVIRPADAISRDLTRSPGTNFWESPWSQITLALPVTSQSARAWHSHETFWKDYNEKIITFLNNSRNSNKELTEILMLIS